MADEKWNMLLLEQGAIALVAKQGRLCKICFEVSEDAASAVVKQLYPQAEQSSQQPLIQKGLKQLREYFQGERRCFDLQLGNACLSDFATRVQQELLKVPYGSVVTYGELAARAGSPRAARAVGRVMSSNPLPLVVPCHRVVNADGRIGEYSAAHGSRTKAWLIDFERELCRKG